MRVRWLTPNDSVKVSSLSRISATALAMSVSVMIALMVGALLPVAATADSCPNAAERFGASGNLPDCRAYEMVTPMIKEDNDYLVDIHGFADGNHVFIESLLPFPGAQDGDISNALSTRTSSGWVTTSVTPPQGPGEPNELDSPETGLLSRVVSFTSDFSAAFLTSPFADDPLDQDKGNDVYRVDIPSQVSSLASLPDGGPLTQELVSQPGASAGVAGFGTYLAGNSADGSRVYFESTAALPTAPGTPAYTPTKDDNGLYERHGDHTYLVGILPDGSPAPCGAEVANLGFNGVTQAAVPDYAAIAPDGSNVVFSTLNNPACEGGVFGPHSFYLRENNGTPQATTVALPGDRLVARSADGSTLITTDVRQGGVGIIYEYDISTGQATVVGEGSVLAFTPDLSHIYYMDHLGTSEAQMYLYENGASKPIMDTNAGAGYAGKKWNLDEGIGFMTDLASTTADGSKFLFLDRANLTSYNTESPLCTEQNVAEGLSLEGTFIKHCFEAYIYNATNGSITCVSCNPNGTPPVASTHFDQSTVGYQAAGTASPFISPEMPALSADGSRAFFETEETLVPQDTNGTYDVYEWENGHIYLLSSGHGSYGSYLVGVSSDGNDAFIQSTDDLLPQDVEHSQLVYDARVDGGFPYAPPVYGCDSGQCQGPQTPAPIFAPPPSSTFVGIGNPVREEIKAAPVGKPAKHKSTKQKRKPPRKHKAKKAGDRAKSGNSKRRRRK